MECIARNTDGAVVGEDPIDTVYVSTLGAYVSGGTAVTIPADGYYYWQYVYWDGDDYHFVNGYVEFSALLDINRHGVAVGTSSVDGRGDAWNGYGSVAIRYDPLTGATTHITDGFERGEALGINDDGEITGWVSQINAPTNAFRKPHDGPIQLLDGLFASQGRAITNRGLIVGTTVEQSTGRTRAFASKTGTQATLLKVPATESSNSGAAYDANDSGWIVGASWRAEQPWEHFASLWKPTRKGKWRAYDLNELRVTGGVILEYAVAINNDGDIIVVGRPDGTDAYGSRRYLLTRAK